MTRQKRSGSATEPFASSEPLTFRDLRKGKRALIIVDARKHVSADYAEVAAALERAGGQPLFVDAWSGMGGDLIVWASVEDVPCVLLLRNGKLVVKLNVEEILGKQFSRKAAGWL